MIPDAARWIWFRGFHPDRILAKPNTWPSGQRSSTATHILGEDQFATVRSPSKRLPYGV